jgi:iron complex outermembrane receptor protein
VGLVAGSGISLAGPSLAQETSDTPPSTARPGIEEIIVQAGESDAAADLGTGDSVTGFDASDLEALGAQSIEDLAGFTPNLEIVTSGATTPTFFIRGVGLNDFNSNSTGAVAIYADDVVKNSPALQLNTLYDIEGVNVLRGPQGTGPARNASAGAIKVYSRKPTGEFGGYLRADYGNYDFLDYEGAVEAPIYEDIVMGRLAFRFSQRDGFGENRCAGAPPRSLRPVASPGTPNSALSHCGEFVPRQAQASFALPSPRFGFDRISYIAEGLPRDVNNLDNWAARGILRFQPTLDTDFLLIAHGARRNEYSRLGQSYGTNVTPNIPGCTPPNTPQCRLRGTLGGPDAEGYVPIEVTQMLQAVQDSTGVSRNDARFTVANQLARNLDTEPYDGDYDKVGTTSNDVYGLSFKGDIALGNALNFTTVTGYDTYDRRIDVDLDFSPNVLFEPDTRDGGRQFVEDLSLTGPLGDLPVTWTLGAFGLYERIEADIETRFPRQRETSNGVTTGRTYHQNILNGAAYASFTWDFWKDFTLDGGVRYQWENREMGLDRFRGDPYNLPRSFDPQRDDFSKRKIFQAPTGEIRLTYRFREDTHAYLKFARGWKSGHFNATAGDRGITVAEPEKINSFEAGLRGSWFQGRLGLNGSLFHYDYENYQIFTVEIPLGGSPEFVVINASDAINYGAEVDAVLRPLPGTFLQARFSWLESQFIDFVQSQATQQQLGLRSVVFVQEIDNSGNRLLNSPQFTVSLTAEQTIPLGRYGSLTARWDGAWTDDTFFDATEGRGIPNFQGDQFLPPNTIGQRAYWLHNLRLGYRTPDGSIEIAGWVRNLTDVAYKTFAFDASALEITKTTIYFTGDPRTYGMSLTAFF